VDHGVTESLPHHAETVNNTTQSDCQSDC